MSLSLPPPDCDPLALRFPPVRHVDAGVGRAGRGLLQTVHAKQGSLLTPVTLFDRSIIEEARGIPTWKLQVRGIGEHHRSVP